MVKIYTYTLYYSDCDLAVYLHVYVLSKRITYVHVQVYLRCIMVLIC